MSDKVAGLQLESIDLKTQVNDSRCCVFFCFTGVYSIAINTGFNYSNYKIIGTIDFNLFNQVDCSDVDITDNARVLEALARFALISEMQIEIS